MWVSRSSRCADLHTLSPELAPGVVEGREFGSFLPYHWRMEQTMNLAERIYQEAQRLPEPLNREVLSFIEYLEFKHGIADRGIENLKMAQQPVMDRIWDNPQDDAWDER